MENFKEIAEKCLAGELSGTFKLASGESVSSDKLERLPNSCKSDIYHYQMWINGVTAFTYTIYGTLFKYKFHSLDVIDFIPDNMQEQIKIDIPEGKVPVMEQTESGVVITWNEKELTYNDIESKYVWDPDNKIENLVCEDICTSNASERFYRKIEAYRKLINIRNYFGLDPHRIGDWVICISMDGTYYTRATRQPLCYEVVFSKQEHAQAAINMLGDELKYLFEPW